MAFKTSSASRICARARSFDTWIASRLASPPFKARSEEILDGTGTGQERVRFGDHRPESLLIVMKPRCGVSQESLAMRGVGAAATRPWMRSATCALTAQRRAEPRRRRLSAGRASRHVGEGPCGPLLDGGDGIVDAAAQNRGSAGRAAGQDRWGRTRVAWSRASRASRSIRAAEAAAPDSLCALNAVCFDPCHVNGPTTTWNIAMDCDSS